MPPSYDKLQLQSIKLLLLLLLLLLSKQGIRLPVSRDHVAGSGQELNEVACYFKLTAGEILGFRSRAQARLLLSRRGKEYMQRQNFGAN